MIPTKLQGFWNLLSLPCEGMSRLASESLDRDLGLFEKSTLRLHQLYCRGCHRYGKQLQFLRIATCQLRRAIDSGATAAAASRSIPPCLPDADRARIKQAIRDGESNNDSHERT